MSYAYTDSLMYNGASRPSLVACGVTSKIGCPWKGTTVCLECPLGEQVAAECDWACGHCEHRATCKCAFDQSARLKAWGLIP